MLRIPAAHLHTKSQYTAIEMQCAAMKLCFCVLHRNLLESRQPVLSASSKPDSQAGVLQANLVQLYATLAPMPCCCLACWHHLCLLTLLAATLTLTWAQPRNKSHGRLWC